MWNKWENLFDRASGEFNESAIIAIDALKEMRVETDYGSGTQYSHWHEQRHDEELMTGFKDATEHVMPVTIKVISLLGHQIAERLPHKTNLNMLLDSLAQITFSQQAEAKSIDLDHFKGTDIWENIPHDQLIKKIK